MEQMLSEDSVDFDYHKLTNDDIKKCFKMETMRLFLDFVFLNENSIRKKSFRQLLNINPESY
jgi:ADP-dependent phosphofructokinase/glucokinase